MTRHHGPLSNTHCKVNDGGTKPVARGPGRPVGDHEAKRLKLLTAAISVLAQEGYAGTSLRKVGKHAGHTTGAVTYYFANKKALVIAIAEHLFDRFDTLLDANDIEEGFRRWLDWANVDADLWLAQFQLLAVARHEPTIAKIFQRRYARYRQIFASILEKGQKRGTVRSDIPAELLADQLSAMADGWMVGRPIEPERFEPRRVQRLLDATINLISPGPASTRKRSSTSRTSKSA
jgi:TetR/AcrR family transcriptional regulator, transcriptional repressor of aconitase